MGEEQKEEEKKEEGGENKEEEKEMKEEEPPDVVLKVDMHCEGCARKVEKSLRKCEGIEEVKTDSKLRKVVVKGKGADPVKLCERVQKKTGRKAEIISPLPKPPEEEKKKEDAPQPEENKEEPKPITVVLRIRMHCEACAQVLQRRIKKMKVNLMLKPLYHILGAISAYHSLRRIWPLQFAFVKQIFFAFRCIPEVIQLLRCIVTLMQEV